jgi:starch phosphorylase
VEDLRHAHYYQDFNLDPMLKNVFKAIREGVFGDAGQFSALVDSIVDHGDYYLVSDDFKSYIDTQRLIDDAYKKQDEWLTKTITSVSRMGFFSSDRCIDEYAEMIWNIEPVKPQANGS